MTNEHRQFFTELKALCEKHEVDIAVFEVGVGGKWFFGTTRKIGEHILVTDFKTDEVHFIATTKTTAAA